LYLLIILERKSVYVLNNATIVESILICSLSLFSLSAALWCSNSNFSTINDFSLEFDSGISTFFIGKSYKSKSFKSSIISLWKCDSLDFSTSSEEIFELPLFKSPWKVTNINGSLLSTEFTIFMISRSSII